MSNLNKNKADSMDFSKLHFSESLEAEQSSSENARMSMEKQANPRSRQRQKDQMAQKIGVTNKSSTVYASEEYFNELRQKVEHRKAQEAARIDWRKDLEEAAIERPQDEGDHPYVDVMPHTHKLPKKPHGNTKPENMPQNQQSMGESLSFDEIFGKLVDEEFVNEMRKQDKVAGRKPERMGPAFEYMKRHIKDLQGGQQKKKVRGAKPTSRPRSEGPTPAQKVANKRAYAANRPDPYRPRAGESD